MKFHTALLLLILFILTSCVSSRRYAAFTKEKITTINQTYHATQTDYLNIKMDSLLVQDSLVKVQKLKSFFIPAILYWQSEHTLKCDLNPKVPAKFFEQEIIRLADSIDLKSKLNGKKLELTILQVPHSFVYTHKETAMIFIVAYFVSGLEIIYPGNSGLKVSYRILENGETKKTGILSVPNTEQPIKNIWKSTKKFTWAYLDQYHETCTKMNKQLFEKLIELF